MALRLSKFQREGDDFGLALSTMKIGQLRSNFRLQKVSGFDRVARLRFVALFDSGNIVFALKLLEELALVMDVRFSSFNVRL